MQNRAKNRKYHYIYKITRFDGKFYIGIHSTDKLEDGYFGSGTYLARSKRKHGLDKHTMEILEFLPSREELVKREKELVCEALIENAMCMNIALGGEGGWNHVHTHPDRILWLKKAGRNGGYANKHLYTKEVKERIAKGLSEAGAEKMKLAWQNKRDAMLEITCSARAASKKPENITKRKETFNKINHQQGEKNSQFGKVWVMKDHKSFLISKCQLEEFVSNGFIKGRKMKCLDK